MACLASPLDYWKMNRNNVYCDVPVSCPDVARTSKMTVSHCWDNFTWPHCDIQTEIQILSLHRNTCIFL